VNKKAALSLGITTIVYLVIAMIIIGSGISFVRMVFDMGEETLGNAMPADDIGLNPTSDNRFVMGSNSITVSRGETTTVQAGIYNTDNVRRDFTINLSDSDCVPTVSGISLSSPSAGVNPGESTGFRAILDVNQSVEDRTYICSLEAVGTDAGDNTEGDDTGGNGGGNSVTLSKQIDITVTT